MRNIIILLALFLSNISFAQRPQNTAAGIHSKIINGLLSVQATTTAAAKTTGINKSRVIAQSTRNNLTGNLVDSVNLRYSANKGSTYDYNNMIYPYNYPYNTSPMFNYAGVFTYPTVLFDTLMHWTVNPNTLIYGYYETDYAHYDTLNLTDFLALYADSAVYPNMICKNNFNAANTITAGFSSVWALGTADSAFKQFFTYNASGRLTKDSTYELHLGTWRLVSKTFYTYDGSNNLVMIENYANTTDTSYTQPLIKQLKYINTFDASNRLLTVLDSTYTGTVFDQYVKDTFAYTGAYAFHTSWKQHQWDPINSYWAPMFYMSKHLTGGGLPDTVFIQSFDSLQNKWVPMTKNVIHYDTANRPDQLNDFEYNFTAYPPTPDFTTRYYYQNYVYNVGVSGIPHSVRPVTIFPNPAGGSITITGIEQNTGLSVSFTNMNGQLVSYETTPWQEVMPVSMKELPPAMYLLIISDTAGNILHRQLVVKE